MCPQTTLVVGVADKLEVRKYLLMANPQITIAAEDGPIWSILQHWLFVLLDLQHDFVVTAKYETMNSVWEPACDETIFCLDDDKLFVDRIAHPMVTVYVE